VFIQLIVMYGLDLDFALVFAVAHEVPNVEALFADLGRALKPKAKLLLAGPAGHVKAEDFEKSVLIAKRMGFAKLVNPPSIRRSQVAAFERLLRPAILKPTMLWR
jgi:SAM-dependent methyltransferase